MLTHFLSHYKKKVFDFPEEIVFQIQMSLCFNFSSKIESYICVTVTRERVIYNRMERLQKYYQNGEKIKVLAASNQKLQIARDIKGMPPQ